MNIYFLHSVERVVKWAKRYTTTRVIYIYIYIVYSVYINYDREDMCTIETITDMHYSSIGFTYEWTFDTLATNSGSADIHPTKGSLYSNIRISSIVFDSKFTLGFVVSIISLYGRFDTKFRYRVYFKANIIDKKG